MAISRVKTWTTNEDLTSSDLNSEFNQVMNNAANTGSAETISARYTFSAGVILDELVATNAAGAGNIKISEFRWDPASGTAADGDGMYIDWVADDAGGTETIMARTGVELTDTDATGEDSEFEIHTMIAATLTKVASFGSAGTTFNTAVTVGVNDTGKDVKFFGATSGQYMLWDESADELVLAGDSKLSFHDAAGGENIIASADGHLEINAGTTLDITATTIDLNGAVAMNGATTGGTNITISGELDAATLDISGNADIDGTLDVGSIALNGTSIYATDLILGEDAQTAIDFGTANEIDFKVDNAVRLTLTSGALYPVTDNQIDLGTSSLEFKDAFFDGTVTADAFAGPLTGDVTGDISGNAATFTATANNSEDETVYPVFVDGATGSQGAETDTGLTYNPSTGALTTTTILPPSGDLGLGHASKPFRVYTDGTYVGMRSGSALNSSGEGSVYVGGNAVYMYAGTVLTFSSTSSSGVVFNDGGVDVDFRIEGASNANLFFADANVDRIGIGTNSPTTVLEVEGDTSISNGYGLIVGHTSQINTNGIVAELQELGTGFADSAFTLGRFSNDANPPWITGVKSRSGTIGTSTIVQDNDQILQIQGIVGDGTDFTVQTQAILFRVDDASPAENAIGGDISFWTNAGALSATERMTIATDGGIFCHNLLAASASTDVNINGSDELHSVTSSGVYKEDYSSGTGSDRVMDLQPRTFTWRHPVEAPDGWAQQVGDPGRRDFGLIAEEVAEVMPELVNYKDGQPYSVRYQMMSVLLLEQLQELKKEIEDLKKAA